jgi:hypothetical protein
LAEQHGPALKAATETLAELGRRRGALERRLAEQGARLRALRETEAAQEGYFVASRP